MTYQSAQTLAHAGQPALPDVRPFIAKVAQDHLDDLALRLATLRWPERETVRETVRDSSQGARLAWLRPLVEHWRLCHDWRATEARLNTCPQYITTLFGVDVHFIHVRSPYPGAVPLLLIHDTPGSVLDFVAAIAPLVDPVRYGGDPRHAFDVVLPTLPGHGFSARLHDTGWGMARTARTLETLMKRLGHSRWFVHCGGGAAAVATRLAAERAQGLAGVHLATPPFPPPAECDMAADEEQRAYTRYRAAAAGQSAFLKLQQTRPGTLAFALADSPLAQVAWICERLGAWEGADGADAAEAARWHRLREHLLDTATLYWLTGTGAAAARFDAQAHGGDAFLLRAGLPAAVTVGRGPWHAPRRWAERVFPELYDWNESTAGDRFAALEDPAAFAAELRRALAPIR